MHILCAKRKYLHNFRYLHVTRLPLAKDKESGIFNFRQLSFPLRKVRNKSLEIPMPSTSRILNEGKRYLGTSLLYRHNHNDINKMGIKTRTHKRLHSLPTSYTKPVHISLETIERGVFLNLMLWRWRRRQRHLWAVFSPVSRNFNAILVTLHSSYSSWEGVLHTHKYILLQKDKLQLSREWETIHLPSPHRTLKYKHIAQVT